MMPNERDRPSRRLRPVDAPRMTQTLNQYLARWLADIVRPTLEPATYAYYETMTRLYISPALGTARLDRLQTHDVQNWLNKLTGGCQCCAQGKDAKLDLRVGGEFAQGPIEMAVVGTRRGDDADAPLVSEALTHESTYGCDAARPPARSGLVCNRGPWRAAA